MAGNQLGKTLAGGAEMAMHLTQRYPDWWEGRVFSGSVVAWTAGVSTEGYRDGAQRILLGRPNEWGTGWIPGDCIVDIAKRRGVEDAVDFLTIKSSPGADVANYSFVAFKSYDQGREKFQAETLHLAWYDEEPEEDIYLEGITRTNATKGMVYMTFTPLMGLSKVVRRFLQHQSDDRHVTRMGLDDAGHLSPEDRVKIRASYPEHIRDARTDGIPALGSGMVFPVSERQIVVDPFRIPEYWPRLGSMDFGWDHPFAATELAWDRDTDTIYVVREYRQKNASPAQHAMVLRTWGDLTWAWPHDGLQHDKGSGIQLRTQYKNQRLRMLENRATFKDKSSGLEAGVAEMLTRMQTGKWKVFSTCQNWIDEYRTYHRDEGKIVKQDDDLISASRYGMMMIRHARIMQPGWRQGNRPTQADNHYEVI
jgi:phage terminase large subunit-like protein